MPEYYQLTYKIFTSVNCGPAARLELFTRPDGLRPGRGQRHIQLYSPWLPANDKSNPAGNIFFQVTFVKQDYLERLPITKTITYTDNDYYKRL